MKVNVFFIDLFRKFIRVYFYEVFVKYLFLICVEYSFSFRVFLVLVYLILCLSLEGIYCYF